MKQDIAVVLVEDDTQVRKLLKLWFKHHFPPLKIVAEAGSVQSAIEAIRTCKPDLVLVDMKLSGGTGIEALQAFPQHDEEFASIILSGYEEFMHDAWQFAPKGYVMKPFDDEKLVTAIKYALRKIQLLQQSKNNNKSLCKNNLDLSLVRRGKTTVYIIDGEYLMVKADKKLVRLRPKQEIMYCTSGRDNTVFCLENETKIIAPEHLGVWENALSEFNFVRIHRSYLLNLAFFRAIEHDEKDGKVVLLNGVKLKLSRSYKAFLVEYLQSPTLKKGDLSKN